MKGLIERVSDRLHPLLGWGYPARTEVWEAQYRNGVWEYLAALDELAHYSILAGYYQYLKPGGSVLDIGCGEGLLQEKLEPFDYPRYVGVDLSSETIRKASSRADERTSFLVADGDEFEPDDSFDVIIFSESLFYFERPARTIERCEGFLKPRGLFLISMHETPEREAIWRRLSLSNPLVDETRVTNRAGTTWVCRVYAASD